MAVPAFRRTCLLGEDRGEEEVRKWRRPAVRGKEKKKERLKMAAVPAFLVREGEKKMAHAYFIDSF